MVPKSDVCETLLVLGCSLHVGPLLAFNRCQLLVSKALEAWCLRVISSAFGRHAAVVSMLKLAVAEVITATRGRTIIVVEYFSFRWNRLGGGVGAFNQLSILIGPLLPINSHSGRLATLFNRHHLIDLVATGGPRLGGRIPHTFLVFGHSGGPC